MVRKIVNFNQENINKVHAIGIGRDVTIEFVEKCA